MATTDLSVERTNPTRSGLEPIGGGRVGLGLAVVSAVLSVLGARAVRWQDVDGYGLISALPPLYWLAVGLALVATVVLFRASRDGEARFATAVPMMWLVILHTAPQMAHAHVRFPTVWTHLGFVRLIDESGTSPVLLDARFAWPGFFGAFVAPLHALPDPAMEMVLRMWPTYITGGSAILVAALARRSYPTLPLIGSLSALAYVLLAWTGQDYFSPQSVGYLIYLAILVIIESGPLRASAAWSSRVPLLARFTTAGGDRPAARSTPAFVALVTLSLGAVVSHPLAPFFICMGLVILGLYGRTVAWRLLVLVGIGYAVWFLISAEPFWRSNLEDLIQNVGDIGSVLNRSTGARVAEAAPVRQFVTRTRSLYGMAIFGSVLVIGIAMVTDRFKYLRPALPLAPLAGIPALAVALQAYGGEIVIRVMLFTLPMASILVGRVLANLSARVVPVVMALVTAAVIPILLVSRFGNESFEMSNDMDRDAIEVAYDYARANSVNDDTTLFVSANSFLPWRDEGIGRNRFLDRPEDGSSEWNECSIAAIDQVRVENTKDQVLVIFTNSTQGWETYGLNQPSDSLDRAAEWLLGRPGTEVIHRGEGTWVLKIDTTTPEGLTCETP